METLLKVAKDLKTYWKTIAIIIIPIVLSPMIAISKTKEATCGYAICVMALYWILELLPLPITALIPVFFFPILGLMKASKVASLFFQDTTMIFLGGFMVALAIERVNLHNRIGTGILLIVGSTPSRILIGFLLPTCFLSMWINNTATTSMMVPAVEAVIDTYRKGIMGCGGGGDDDDDDGSGGDGGSEDGDDDGSGYRRRRRRRRRGGGYESGGALGNWGRVRSRSDPYRRCWSNSDGFGMVVASSSIGGGGVGGADINDDGGRCSRGCSGDCGGGFGCSCGGGGGRRRNVVVGRIRSKSDCTHGHGRYRSKSDYRDYRGWHDVENRRGDIHHDPYLMGLDHSKYVISVIEVDPVDEPVYEPVVDSVVDPVDAVATNRTEFSAKKATSPATNQLNTADKQKSISVISLASTAVAKDLSKITKEAVDHQIKNFAKMLCLAIAFGSLVGGTGTLTGSTTNLLVAEEIGKAFEIHGLKNPLTYANWLFFGLPHVVICLILLWFWLQIFFIGWRSFVPERCASKISKSSLALANSKREEKAVREILASEYKKLGPLSFGEIMTISLMVLLVLLWIFRDPGFMPGYAVFFRDGYVSDSFPPILITILLFIIPMEKPDFICWKSEDRRARSKPALLNWSTVSEKLPWGPIILIGGGFVLAEGCEVSGLSDLLAKKLDELAGLSPWLISAVVTIIVAFVTEIMTNVTVMAIFSPILIAMADHFNVNPLYFVFPSGIAASYAFMLPIAAPSNAIVFAYGHLTVVDLLKVGFCLKILSLLIIILLTNSLGVVIFDMKTLPWGVSNSSYSTTTMTSIIS